MTALALPGDFFAVALAVTLLGLRHGFDADHPPRWLSAVGSWSSIVVLVALGALNVATVFRTPRGEMTRVKGWRSGAFARLLRAGHPLSVMAVGTLFAISFDTISQAILFAVTATPKELWFGSAVLAVVGVGFLVGQRLA